MLMYNLLELSGNYSTTSTSLWNYYRDEVNDADDANDAKEINDKDNKTNNNK